ncbi:penicillin-binding protein 2 [Mobilitalea sibirica]|uniref:Penicillin-binding protein 2 n=1 Tax=Mobilitalea sibirica TaxID=1462919 RepID=A0A8J7HCW2_9FIRM|nr:penicillin-binding protein 2 [Mobilitalea sibirica]MBH1941362.1 penicillin-binding protein 2 [Mobilitalea sibirica]
MEKSSAKLIKKFSSRMQARLLLVFCVITLLLVGLIGRLVYIMQTDGERYAKQVLSRQSYVSAVLPYKRGEILDRNGTVLARSELRYKLILDPKNLLMNAEYIPPTLIALKDHFNIPEETVREILDKRPNSQYTILAKNLNYKEMNDFKAFMEKNSAVKSVWFEEEYVRTYPYGTLASDLIGFTSTDNRGFFGIEEYYNEELNGTNGREYGYYDSSLNIERIVKKPENGHSIVTTIDSNVQRIIQKHIKEFNEETGSLNIGVLVMNPNDGGIIAMASNKEYDLNNPRSLEGIIPEEELQAMTPEQKLEALNKLWRNDAISSGYEPGSTFKPITVASALEEAIINENTTFHCDGGEEVGGWYIKCSNVNGHGEVTLEEALMKSCNDALMQIAAAEGRDIFYRYQNYFEFGRKTGIDLPGEEAGIITALQNLNATELATASFGQTFNVTMIQMAAAYSSLVNGGKYFQPHVMQQIINDSGATVKQMDQLLIRQTVSKETSEFIQKAMYQTVEVGTAKGAKVEGYAIGGKTGTAQKYPRDAKTYLVSFLGAVPAINPEIVIYVIIDEPQNVPRQDNSSIATEFAGRILKEILPTLGIYPEGEIDYLLPTNEEDQDNNNDDPDNNGQDDNTDNMDNTNNTDSSGDTQTDNGQNNETSGSDSDHNDGDNSATDDADEVGDISGEGNADVTGETETNTETDTNTTTDLNTNTDISEEELINSEGEMEDDEWFFDEEEFNGAAIGPMDE